MIPVVNNKYRYIFFYNPKSACSVARKLFLDLHRDELSPEQLALMSEIRGKGIKDEWFNLHQLFPVDLHKDYSDYYKFTLVRHPFTRFISAYLNRIVMFKSDRDLISTFLKTKYGEAYEVTYSFNQFFDFFSNTPIEEVTNEHYLPQCYFKNSFNQNYLTTQNSKTNLTIFLRQTFAKIKKIQPIHVNSICKMENLEKDLRNAYQPVFANDNEKLTLLDELLGNMPMHNVTLSAEGNMPEASDLSVDQLMSMDKMPSYTSFLTPNVTQILEKKFAKDFALLGYEADLSQSLLNFESSKNIQINKTIPTDFDWEIYLANNADLGLNGINSRAKAINHWIHHGRHEGRSYLDS